MKIALKFLGALLIFISLIAILVLLVEIADPVSAKMADDNDPFGPPTPLWKSLVGLAISCGIGLLGIRLWLGKALPRPRE
ncbi:MAG: hypothetical protein B9S32_00045 [Verrucomicrobia bacterium Tous-C9LFEB]|nr:MAG: hypothetical protein B9S32_00045 [Verrucomicrobia bacterium Tous-C9LFEB]